MGKSMTDSGSTDGSSRGDDAPITVDQAVPVKSLPPISPHEPDLQATRFSFTNTKARLRPDLRAKRTHRSSRRRNPPPAQPPIAMRLPPKTPARLQVHRPSHRCQPPAGR